MKLLLLIAFLVLGSVYGRFHGHFRWRDREDNHITATGVPESVPGIALPYKSTLGQWFEVTAPNGRTLRLRQTDIGPAYRTGRGVDINAAAAEEFGYTPKTFPTDGLFIVKPVSKP